jgi:hypothetical protein
MKYTGTVIPAKRNAATPQAVACWLPCLLACAKTPAEIAAARATPSRKAGGLADTAARYAGRAAYDAGEEKLFDSAEHVMGDKDGIACEKARARFP